jgi:hypothetical protein
MTATRFFPATGLVFPQIEEKEGEIFGAFASGIASLLKVKAQPSTDPSATLTVGPVIAGVHTFAPGDAWKYPQYRQPVSAECADGIDRAERIKVAINNLNFIAV